MATAQVSSDLQLGFPAKGSLQRVPFPRLVREIGRNKLTGSLYLLSGQTKKVVFFEEGQPIFVRSNVLAECLGQILAQEGLITEEQCEQTLEAIRRTGKKQGELLVEMGILSEGNLRYGLAAQLRAKLFEIFTWEDGRYQFKSDPNNLSFGIRLALSSEGVIIGALQDRYPEDRAQAGLAPYLTKFVTVNELDAEDEDEALDLLPEELHFARCLDGSRTVAEVLARDPSPNVPTPKALLLGLISAGVAELSDTVREARPPLDPPSLTANRPDDADLIPEFDAHDSVTEYEDTPLPGELPKVRGLPGDAESGFDDVEKELKDEQSNPPARVAAAPPPTPTEPLPAVEEKTPTDLFAAEPNEVEETFDEAQARELEESAVLDKNPVRQQLGLESPPAPALVGMTVELDASDLDVVRDTPDESAATLDGRGDADVPETPRFERFDTERSEEERRETESREQDDFHHVDLDLGQELQDSELGGLDHALLEADDDLLLPEELDGIDLASGGPLGHTAVASTFREPTSPEGTDLIDFAELDGVDLGLNGVEVVDPLTELPPSESEIVGARRFNEAETAMADGDYPEVVSLLESAYKKGFDVAELHAMLAYARFMASGQLPTTAQHAFELLDYAQSMDPSLDLVHAYRGAIFQAIAKPQQAREALGRALELNPYCQLAIELMDQL